MGRVKMLMFTYMVAIFRRMGIFFKANSLLSLSNPQIKCYIIALSAKSGKAFLESFARRLP